jgi:hypothetical protein
VTEHSAGVGWGERPQAPTRSAEAQVAGQDAKPRTVGRDAVPQVPGRDAGSQRRGQAPWRADARMASRSRTVKLMLGCGVAKPVDSGAGFYLTGPRRRV